MRRAATIVLILLCSLAPASAQDQRDTLRYPYGCIEDETRRPFWWKEGDRNPIRCTTSNFSVAQFDSLAFFRDAQFDKRADFSVAQFDNWADFTGAQFDSLAFFNLAQFDSLALFSFARFDSLAFFNLAQFDSWADFSSAQFDRLAEFSFAQFDRRADFSSAQFWSPVDFRRARFDSAATASFARTTVRDTLFAGIQGSDDVQRFDFRRVQFLGAGRDDRISPGSEVLRLGSSIIDTVAVRFPGAAVVLYGPVELQMQRAKIRFLHLAEDLSYFDKEDIVTYLKEKSFPGDEVAHFELDYLLARSIMRQRPSGTYQAYPWHHPTRWWNEIYSLLMGLGYRPFRIFAWAGLFIVLFSLYYLLVLPNQINTYLDVKARAIKIPWRVGPWSLSRYRYDHLLNTFISCVYFSAMTFFTFRLKKDILTFFSRREKYVIVSEWTLGFLVYVAFLTLAKSGSILQQLKTLFIG